VGVTPVTAVPARLTWRRQPQVRVDFVDAASREVPLSDVQDYASEAGNSGNVRHVTRIEVSLPSPRLRDGVLFVDTPGVGSLARNGGRETLAYLPQCDLAVMLVDAGSTLDNEDLALLRLLLEAGTPVLILLSKSDLLSPADRSRMLNYVREQVGSSLGVELPVIPVTVVGPEKTLFDEWFDREIVPLCDRHHELMRASLRRKLAHLRDAVRVSLELLAHRQDGNLLPGAHAHMQDLLQSGDDLLSDAKLRALDRRQKFERQPEDALRLAAEVIVQTDGRNSERQSALRRAVESVMREQASSAADFAVDLRRQLTDVLRKLQQFSPDAGIESGVLDRSPPTGLPVPGWNRPGDCDVPGPPWWSMGIQSIGRRIVLRRLWESDGAGIRAAHLDYSRMVEIWLRDDLARLTFLYETQVEVVRQWLRRSDGTSVTGEAVDQAGLAQDIRLLREIGNAGPAPDVVQSSAAMSPDGPDEIGRSSTAATE